MATTKKTKGLAHFHLILLTGQIINIKHRQGHYINHTQLYLKNKLVAGHKLMLAACPAM